MRSRTPQPEGAGAVQSVQGRIGRLRASALDLLQDMEPAPSQDAAIVLALAWSTVSSACSVIDEAERWLRALRAHGRVGAALESLGVDAAPLETMTDPPFPGGRPGAIEVTKVAARAAELARLQAARTLDTVHVLFSVAEAYGAAFDRALYARGPTREALLGALPHAGRAPVHA